MWNRCQGREAGIGRGRGKAESVLAVQHDRAHPLLVYAVPDVVFSAFGPRTSS